MPKGPQAPQHLADPTRVWWRSVMADYDFESHHVRLLTLACEAWDRGQQAREHLAEHGLTFLDRFDQPKARPEVGIEPDSRTSFARLIRELGLDVADPDDSRPPRIGD